MERTLPLASHTAPSSPVWLCSWLTQSPLFLPSSTPRQFVLQDLKKAQANRNKVPWIVVYTHHPFLCSDIIKEDRCAREAPHYRAQMEDMFQQYGVDLFVSGHNHKCVAQDKKALAVVNEGKNGNGPTTCMRHGGSEVGGGED